MDDFLIKFFTISILCCGGCVGGWWYSPSEVCSEMVSEQWYGDKETCPAYYESGYQPCLIESSRKSAYCRRDYVQYKVFDAVSTGNGELTYIGTYTPNGLMLVCGEMNPFCEFWQR